MTAHISPNGKGHRLLQYLSEREATFDQIARDFGLHSQQQRSLYTWRLQRLCRDRRVSWVERYPGEYDAYSDDWWEYGEIEFRLTRRGEISLEAIGHDWTPRVSVRIFA
tara:strand:+ start:1923 stop:2249 length:327 start_codon:yes stop_codon:yes gene_type:complete